MIRTARRAGALLAASMLLASPTVVQAGTPKQDPLVELLVESADTPKEHAALASYYRARAKAARATAERHRSMGNHYGGNEAMRRKAQEHCARMAKAAEELAAQYDALAALHEPLGKP